MSNWQDKAAAKRQQRDSVIPDRLRIQVEESQLDVSAFDFSTVLSARELEITNVKDVTTLLAKLASGEYTAEETVRAFSARALVAHQLVNCLTETFIDEALERAKELDAAFAKGGPTGPLHGLPISLKDQIDVKGQEMTMGYVGWLGKISEKDAIIYERLKSLGAVSFCRTNVPQALMFGEADNNLFGTTLNPYNRKLTSGGSSGGEGALIALRGSVLGVGSDIGGSIRIPSAFCGLYGLRPSYNRVPYAGTTNSMEGQEMIYSVLGPMSASLDGLKLFMQAIAASKPWLYDPLALRLPWSDSEYALAEHGGGERLCFAILSDDGYCRPHPPYIRALEMTRKALEAAGHEVIDWEPYKTAQGLEIINNIFNADGGHDIDRVCELSGEPRMGTVLDRNAKHLPTWESWQIGRAKQLYIKEHLDHWQATRSRTSTGRPVDAILAPTGAGCPQEHGTFHYIYYTGFCNLCDYSTATLPVTRVDPSVDIVQPAHEFRSEADKTVYNFYNPETYKNAPIGIQVIGRKNEEEAVIRMTEIVDEALRRQS